MNETNRKPSKLFYGVAGFLMVMKQSISMDYNVHLEILIPENMLN